MIGFLVLIGAIYFASAKPHFVVQPKIACGYDGCPEVDFSSLNVHIVPHSHDDVGWLKTVDQYYYGSHTNIQRAGVQYIISSVIRELERNPKRRFVQVESAFFFKWWEKQNEETKELVKNLVNNGQLEMIGGAWSMNDEAAVHYQSTIDQFTLGLGRLNDTFGECGRPKIGWQIDPFGHSREIASIFAQLGYDGLLFARLDYRDRSKRMSDKEQDFIWRTSSSLSDADLFTSVLYNHYSAPSGFCFDVNCGDDPIIDDEDSFDYNFEEKVKSFLDQIRMRADTYKTNNILITMGDDFNYQDALSYFTNIDKLVKGFELFPQFYNDLPVKVFYSTPSCYVKAVHDEAAAESITFSVKTDDFFPYASDAHSYWTGYFTSRPTSKRFERQSSNLLQVAKQIAAYQKTDDDLTALKEAVGIMQHHDAITGTEKQAVANDYHRILSKAIDKAEQSTSDRIMQLLKKSDSNDVTFNFRSCLLSNVSYCEQSSGENFVVAVYNPLSRSVSHYVRLPVSSTSFKISDPEDNEVAYQMAPSAWDFSYTNLNTSKFELVFLAENLPPLGSKLYRISKNANDNQDVPELNGSNDDFALGDENVGVELDPETGKLRTVIINGNAIFVRNELKYYLASDGNSRRSSGAYVFQPENNDSTSFTETVQIETYKGELFDEVHQTYSNWAKQIIRVYKTESFIEFDWIVGPINLEDQHGFEVINTFTTLIESNDTFYTDSNGREVLKRRRDFRETYDFSYEEPTTSNYYPVTSKIVIKDENWQFAVLNDRAQGGSSLQSGEVELMVHRACTRDDGFGVGESLNETEYGRGKVARGQHFVTFGSIAGSGKSQSAIERDIEQRKLLAPWVFVAEMSDDGSTLGGGLELKFAGLTRSLPDNIQILTLEPWKGNSVLLRLEHVLENEDDPVLSLPTNVDLNGLFTYFEINTLRETTLAANQWLEENDRLHWDFMNDQRKAYDEAVNVKDDVENLNITMLPMQIRTFVASVTYI